MKFQVVLLFVIASHVQALRWPGLLGWNRRASTTTATPSTTSKKMVKDCCFLTGTWVNDHGSVIVLNHQEDGTLTGEFLTAVETTVGASGGIQTLHGRVGKGQPTTFGMVVTFKNGDSTTAWSGQYHMCNGKETLMTTWILTSSTGSCKQHWLSTRVGQDRFVRKVAGKDIMSWLSYNKKNKFAKKNAE